NVFDIAEAFGIDIHFEGLGTAMESFLTKDAIALDDVHMSALCFPIIEDMLSGILKLGVCLFMLPKTETEEAGLSIIPYGSERFEEDLVLDDNLVLQVKAAMDLAGGIAVLIRPDKDIKLLFDIFTSVSSTKPPPSSDSIMVALKSQG